MPSVYSDLRARTEKDKARRRELHRCQTDLWYLASEVMNYKWNPKLKIGLTEQFHKPICDWLQAHRDTELVGMWLSRGYHKSTLVAAQMMQDWLIDPSHCNLYWHAVQDRASDIVTELVGHVFSNDTLRSLDPVMEYPHGSEGGLSGQPFKMFPSKQAKRWHNTNGFTFGKASITGAIDRRPRAVKWQSLLALGAGSEVTGAHGDKGYLDDPIAKNDIEDGQLPKKKAWYGNTVIPVIDGRKIIRATGTPWGDWGMYRDWKDSKNWRTLFIPGSTREAYVDGELNLAEAVDWSKKKIHLEPDYKLEYPVYGLPSDKTEMRRRLNLQQQEMAYEFPPQIMVDESPEGEKPWARAECEHDITSQELRQLPGQFFILSDPAPAGPGAADETKQKTRGDGSKDDWATCLVKIGVRGQRQNIVLVDGTFSKEWGPDAGLDVICDYLRRRPGARVYIEGYGFGAKTWDFDMRRAARRNNVRYRSVKFKGSRVASAKNLRFKKLADRAKDDEFMIYEGCSEDFREKFLEQARGWRPLPKGRNSLRFDDCADVVSMAVNNEILAASPKEDYEEDQGSPFRDQEPEEAASSGGRYVRW